MAFAEDSLHLNRLRVASTYSKSCTVCWSVITTCAADWGTTRRTPPLLTLSLARCVHHVSRRTHPALMDGVSSSVHMRYSLLLGILRLFNDLPFRGSNGSCLVISKPVLLCSSIRCLIPLPFVLSCASDTSSIGTRECLWAGPRKIYEFPRGVGIEDIGRTVGKICRRAEEDGAIKILRFSNPRIILKYPIIHLQY